MKIPSGVFLKLTNRCNAGCMHCHVSAGDPWENELNTSEIKDLINHVVKFNPAANLTFTGGEPLSRKDFLEICKYANDKGLSFAIFTNGTLVDDFITKKVKKMSNLRAIGVSLDGGSATVHDAIHGTGNFRLITTLIQKLVHIGIPVEVHVCLNGINFCEYKAIISLAKKLGASLTHIVPVLLEGRARENRNALEIPPDQIAEVAFYCFFHKKVFFEISSCNGNCKNNCVVFPNGDVAPCIPLYLKGMGAGSIRRKPLSKIWMDSTIFKKLRSPSINEIESCRKCKYWRLCGGGCRATAYEFSGDLYGPQDPRECEWRKNYFAKIYT